MESFRKQLDALMGANRNGDVQEVKRRYFDRDVCKLYLAGLCPHDLFQLTKMDLGPCPKIHSLQLRKEYNEQTKHSYNRELKECLEKHASECDRKIQRALKRLDEDDINAATAIAVSEVTRSSEVLEYTKQIKEKIKAAEDLELQGRMEDKARVMEEVEALRARRADRQAVSLLEAFNKDKALLQNPSFTPLPYLPPDAKTQDIIKEKLNRAEALGEQGMVDEAEKALEEAEALKRLLPIGDPSKPQDSRATDQKLRVCDICGAYLSIYDSDRRLADHFGGKLHLGHMRIREKLAELREEERMARSVADEKARERAATRDLDSERRDRGVPVRDRNREKERDRGHARDRGRKRSRSPSRDRVRERSRDLSPRDRRGHRWIWRSCTAECFHVLRGQPDMERKVAVNATTLVRPSSPGLPRRILLSAFSHMLWFVDYMTRYLFFAPPTVSDSHSFDPIVERLKAALAKTLVEFYPLAGRLAVRGDGLIQVVCNGDGALFIEAASEVSLEELEKFEKNGHFDGIPAELLDNLAQIAGYDLSHPWSDAPLILIQVTRFSCGGVCVSCKYNHQLIDGDTLWHFLKSWAEVSCEKALSIPPVVIDTPADIAVSNSKSPLEVPADFVRCPNFYLQPSPTPRQLPNDCKMRCFVFDKKMISELKTAHPGFTTFQLLTAHIWNKVTQARRLPEDKQTALAFAVNCRGKAESVPRGYVGEAALLAKVTTRTGELLASATCGASLVRQKVVQVNDEFVRSYCKFIGPDASGQNTVIVPMSMDTDLNVGSSFYFDVFLDFGFGTPVGMTTDGRLGDGQVLFFPAREAGRVAAYVSLKSDVMERLDLVCHVNY